MIVDVISASYQEDYKIQLTFENGRQGVVDFKEYLHKGGVFEKFKDLAFFKTFEVNPELGVITWGNEIDIAPETLYSKATKEPLPEWVQA